MHVSLEVPSNAAVSAGLLTHKDLAALMGLLSEAELEAHLMRWSDLRGIATRYPQLAHFLAFRQVGVDTSAEARAAIAEACDLDPRLLGDTDKHTSALDLIVGQLMDGVAADLPLERHDGDFRRRPSSLQQQVCDLFGILPTPVDVPSTELVAA